MFKDAYNVQHQTLKVIKNKKNIEREKQRELIGKGKIEMKTE